MKILKEVIEYRGFKEMYPKFTSLKTVLSRSIGIRHTIDIYDNDKLICKYILSDRSYEFEDGRTITRIRYGY